jgi:hypothetical protein
MCNGLNHQSGCDCGFGPPYPGTVELVETVEWIDEATTSEAAFKRGLEDLNFDRPTLGRFLGAYREIQSLQLPKDTIKDKIKNLVNQLEYRVEESELVPVKVPLFKLHSPAVKKAKVIYRESDAPGKDGWWLIKMLRIGTGPTKTLKVAYTPSFISVKGECLQVYVPLILKFQLVGVYTKEGGLKSRGISTDIEGIEEQSTLRKRGRQRLPREECVNKALLGAYQTQKYALSMQSGNHVEKFPHKLNFNIARTVELHVVKVFGRALKPLADVKHERQIDLEYLLPGNHDYHLCFNSTGLHWDVV